MSNRAVKDVLEIFNNGWNAQVILYGPPGTSKTYSATIISAIILAAYKKAQKDIEADAAERVDTKQRISEIAKQIISGIIADDGMEDKAKELFKELGMFSIDGQGDLFGMASRVLEEINKGTDNADGADKEERYKLVQFHPSYSYEDFVRGITVKPKDGQMNYIVEPKIIEKFSKACDPEHPKVLIIDEINRAPLGSVLGELIYGLEYRGNEITTSYELENRSKLKIPQGLFIIGTMNTADRSIGSMDYAVRRRFAFVQVPSEGEVIEKTWAHIGGEVKALYEKLMDDKEGIFNRNLLQDQEMDVNDIKIGHTYFLGKGKASELDKREAEEAYMLYRLKYQIIPIYLEYIKDGMIKTEGKKVLMDLLKDWDYGKAVADMPQE